MRMTLQQMIASTIEQANHREKLAQEEEMSQEEKDKKKKEEEEAKKKESMQNPSVDSDTVEKTASAIEYILRNSWVKIAADASTSSPAAGVGIGPSALSVNIDSAMGGEQNCDLGAANTQCKPGFPRDDVGKEDGQVNPETAILTNMMHVPGGEGTQPQTALTEKVSSVRRMWAFKKYAEDALNPAKIEAGKEPVDPSGISASEENVPKTPAVTSSQENMISSNEAAINYTKQDAKAEPKKQMDVLLSEPAQKKSTDPVLQNNLDAASNAGVKISSVQVKAARAWLKKLAQAEQNGEELTEEEKEKLKKAKEAINENGKEKQSQGFSQMQSPFPTTPMTPGTSF